MKIYDRNDIERYSMESNVVYPKKVREDGRCGERR